MPSAALRPLIPSARPAPLSALQGVELPGLAPDTLIATPDGPRAVADLEAGHRVTTRDHGVQPLLWTARIDRALLVSPDPAGGGLVTPATPCLIAPRRAMRLFGRAEVLAQAGDLAGPAAATGPAVVLLLPVAGLIRLGGCLVETFRPDAAGIAALGDALAADLCRAVPRLAHATGRSAFADTRLRLDKADLALLSAPDQRSGISPRG